MNLFVTTILFVCLNYQSQVRCTSTIQPKANLTGTPDLTLSKPHPAIIDGFVATSENFPYAVRIYVYTHQLTLMCTGQAVAKTLVMTAAHCLEIGGKILVVGGPPDHTDFVQGRNLDKYAIYRVQNYYIHPKFTINSYMHDVCLLKVARPMIHDGFAAIKLSYDMIYKPVSVSIYGWGGTRLVKKNNKLYGKNIEARNCSIPELPHEYRFICLIGEGISHGDSGGGLVHNGFLYGIASFYHKQSVREDEYFYMSMAEEQSFVKPFIEKNGTNYNTCFRFFTLVSFILLLFF